MTAQPFFATTPPALDGSFWMPPQASNFAADTDFVFYFILITSAVFFFIITLLIIWFPLRYRMKTKGPAADQHSHSTSLELFWSIIPSILVVIIFYLGFTTFMDKTTPPANAEEIHVRGFQFGWEFTYVNQGGVKIGHTQGLYVPKDRPVVLVMESSDVIHSFFIPAFRVKRDVVPGRIGRMWFQATKASDDPAGFRFFCTEFCGTGHSDMHGRVHVLEHADYVDTIARLGAQSYTASVAFEPVNDRHVGGIWQLQLDRVEQRGELEDGHTAPINAVAISANGNLTITAGDDGIASIWSKTGTSHTPPTSITIGAPIRAAAFSRESDVAAFAAGNTVHLYRITARDTTVTATAAAQLELDAAVNALDFAANRLLLVGTENGGRLLAAVAGDQWRLDNVAQFGSGSMARVAISSTGTLALTTAGGNEATLWKITRTAEATTVTSEATLGGHTAAVTAVDFAERGELVLTVTASADGTIVVSALTDQAQIDAAYTVTVSAHVGGVAAVAASSDGSALLSGGSADQRVRFWQLELNETLSCRELSNFALRVPANVRAVAIGPGEDPVERGRAVYRQYCAICHDLPTFPQFAGAWGATHEFTNAPPTVFDEAYVRESIIDPAAKIRAEYANLAMPSFRGVLSDEQIINLTFYIRSLSNTGQ